MADHSLQAVLDTSEAALTRPRAGRRSANLPAGGKVCVCGARLDDGRHLVHDANHCAQCGRWQERKEGRR